MPLPPRDDLSSALVRAFLDYSPVTGEFWWLRRIGDDRSTAVFNGMFAGKCAGFLGKDGYRRIKVFGQPYLEHRLAWVCMTGEWPSKEVDHANGIKDDNRWCNLRSATRSQNCANARRQKSNRSGFKGASFRTRDGVFAAQIRKDGRQYFIGNFSTAQEAHDAYVEAARRMHGEFARAR